MVGVRCLSTAYFAAFLGSALLAKVEPLNPAGD